MCGYWGSGHAPESILGGMRIALALSWLALVGCGYFIYDLKQVSSYVEWLMREEPRYSEPGDAVVGGFKYFAERRFSSSLRGNAMRLEDLVVEEAIDSLRISATEFAPSERTALVFWSMEVGSRVERGVKAVVLIDGGWLRMPVPDQYWRLDDREHFGAALFFSDLTEMELVADQRWFEGMAGRVENWIGEDSMNLTARWASF